MGAARRIVPVHAVSPPWAVRAQNLTPGVAPSCPLCLRQRSTRRRTDRRGRGAPGPVDVLVFTQPVRRGVLYELRQGGELASYQHGWGGVAQRSSAGTRSAVGARDASRRRAAVADRLNPWARSQRRRVAGARVIGTLVLQGRSRTGAAAGWGSGCTAPRPTVLRTSSTLESCWSRERSSPA